MIDDVDLFVDDAIDPFFFLCMPLMNLQQQRNITN
jgi:hypothetical protein